MEKKFIPPTPPQHNFVTHSIYENGESQFSVPTPWKSRILIREINATTLAQDNTSYASKAIEVDACLKNDNANLHSEPVVIGLPSPVSSTPLKENFKTRRLEKPRLKKHRPKIVDDELKYQPKTTPESSIPEPKRKHVRNTNSKMVSDSSEEVVITHKSCRRALNFDLDNKAEDGRNVGEDVGKQALKMSSGEKEEKQNFEEYQWKNKQKGHIVIDTSAPVVQGSMVRNIINFDSWHEAKGEIGVIPKTTEVSQGDGNSNKLPNRLTTSKPQNEELYVERISCVDGQTSVGVESQDLYSSVKLKRRVWLGRTQMPPVQHLISKEQCIDNEDQNVNKRVELSKKEVVTRKRPKQQEQNRTPQCTAIVSYKGTPDFQYKATVDLDEESVRASNVLMIDCGATYDDEDSEKKEYWARERSIIRKRVKSFLSSASVVQGDRRFTQWEGSVVDSVVGAFLTQNVSDNFSGSAFMSLAGTYPAKNSNRRLIALDETPSTHCALVKIDKLSPDGFMQEEVDMEKDKNEEVMGRGENEDNYQFESVLKKDGKEKRKKDNKIIWNKLRKYYSSGKPRDNKIMDVVDWEAVRQASPDEIAAAIRSRGMNNVLAKRIQEFLDSVSENHGSIDLEWLRHVPPQDTKDFLLSIFGMGLKSVECIRLLTLQHVAFPVDTNVGRIAVRLGWVPLKPLPDGLQLHLLETYPPVNSIQKYLYPRLCTLDHKTLYELHYHMITFGKVYCTKQKPHCNTCPMKRECKHFASASASEGIILPLASESIDTATAPVKATPLAVEKLDASASKYQSQYSEPIIVLLSEEESELEDNDKLLGLEDIEDLYKDTMDSDEDIITIRLDSKSCKENILDNAKRNSISNETGTSEDWAVVASPAPLPRAVVYPRAPLPRPIFKYKSRERTMHQVYVLPHSHPILEAVQVDRRDQYDPSPYLFAVWEEGTQGRLLSQTSKDCSRYSILDICHEIEEHSLETASGTLLIPVRTANHGAFPLNGTYFQVNEVFADDESTQTPIVVPKKLLSDLPKRILFCGTSATTTFKGLSVELMKHAFHHGYFCNRGFNRKTGLPTNLGERFHVNTTKTRGRKIKGASAKQ